jgi:hypothetical protein
MKYQNLIILLILFFVFTKVSSGYTYTPPNPPAWDVPVGYVRVEALEMMGEFKGIATAQKATTQPCADFCNILGTDCLGYVGAPAVNGVQQCHLLKSFTGARNTSKPNRNSAGQVIGTMPSDYRQSYFKVLPGAWTGCPR